MFLLYCKMGFIRLKWLKPAHPQCIFPHRMLCGLFWDFKCLLVKSRFVLDSHSNIYSFLNQVRMWALMHSWFNESKALGKLWNVFSKVNTWIWIKLFFFFWRAQPPNSSFGRGLLLQSHDSLPIFPHCQGLMSGRKLKPVRCGSVVATRLWGLSSLAKRNDDRRNLICFWVKSIEERRCSVYSQRRM